MTDNPTSAGLIIAAIERLADRIDARLTAIDGRLNGIDSRLNHMDRRLTAMEEALAAWSASYWQHTEHPPRAS
jgi:hypothetical protein